MKKIALSDNLSLSAVAQGFWRLDSWKFTTQELVSFMHGCLDRGVTTFDTAEIYGDTLCESLMGEAFAADPSIRNRIELVSKMGIYKEKINGQDFGYYRTTYDQVMESCKASLQRLKTDHLDLYLVQNLYNLLHLFLFYLLLLAFQHFHLHLFYSFYGLILPLLDSYQL